MDYCDSLTYDRKLTGYIKDELLCHGADLVGFGDLIVLLPEQRYNLPVGISVAVKYPKQIIKGISELLRKNTASNTPFSTEG